MQKEYEAPELTLIGKADEVVMGISAGGDDLPERPSLLNADRESAAFRVGRSISTPPQSNAAGAIGSDARVSTWQARACFHAPHHHVLSHHILTAPTREGSRTAPTA